MFNFLNLLKKKKKYKSIGFIAENRWRNNDWTAGFNARIFSNKEAAQNCIDNRTSKLIEGRVKEVFIEV